MIILWQKMNFSSLYIFFCCWDTDTESIKEYHIPLILWPNNILNINALQLLGNVLVHPHIRYSYIIIIIVKDSFSALPYKLHYAGKALGRKRAGAGKEKGDCETGCRRVKYCESQSFFYNFLLSSLWRLSMFSQVIIIAK